MASEVMDVNMVRLGDDDDDDLQDIELNDEDILNDPSYQNEVKELEERIYYEVRNTEKFSYSNILIIDNVPVVNEEKLPKLLNVLKKILSQFGPLKEGGIFLPHGKDANDQFTTLGYAFVEFEDEKSCSAARANLDQHPLDRQHIFSVIEFTQFPKYVSLSDTFVPPKTEEYHEMEDLNYWLRDERAREQFVLRYADDTGVFFNNGGGHGIDAAVSAPDLVYQRRNWTDAQFHWSSFGSYIATLHPQGAALWAGPTWKRIIRFPHPNANIIEFSPCETYGITSSAGYLDEQVNPRQTIVWDIRTGKEIRAFPSSGFPMSLDFKWSHDEKYLARAGESGIFVYESPNLQLLDKKSIKVDNLQEFHWSPSNNYIAYWVPEDVNAPARVTIMEIPSRNTVRIMNLFNVTECKLLWSPSGDYLSVKVERYSGKSRKPMTPNIEIFRLRERDIPVEVLEVKEPILSFSWEPKGTHLIVISGEFSRSTVSFYSVEARKKTAGTTGHIHLLKALEKKNLSDIYWSPEGQFVVLGGAKNLSGLLEFWNVHTLEMMASNEHYMFTDVQWDPSGRFVLSISSAHQHQVENGYCIWDFRGKLVYKQLIERLYQTMWRPRPPTLLSKENQKEVRKNIKEFIKEFEELDDMLKHQMSRETIEERRRLADEWRKFIQASETKYKEERDLRVAIRGYDSNGEEEFEVTEEIIEELVDEKIEYLD